MSIQMSISSLPHANRPWSTAVYTAHQKLHQSYCTGSAYIESGSVEPHHLQQYGQAIISDAYPLLLLLSETAESEGLPMQWIEYVTTDFTALLALINDTWMSAKNEHVKNNAAKLNLICNFSRSVANITIPQPIHITGARKRGRPRKNIDPNVLHEAFQKGRQISTTVLASILGVDQKTLQARKNELGIDSGFDKISDSDLDDLVRRYHQENPAGGRSYIIGHLRAIHSLRIQ